MQSPDSKWLKKHWKAVAVAVLAGMGVYAYFNVGFNVNFSEETADSGDLEFMIPVLNLEDPSHDISVIDDYLMDGDIVVFPPDSYLPVSALKSEINGLRIGTGGTNYETLIEGISRIPGDVDYVTYDYEKGFTPEWTTDQNATISHFKGLFEESHRNGKQFIAAPVYIYGKDWDWGEVSKSTDIIVVQAQNFQTGAKVPEDLKPDNFGYDLKTLASKLASDIKPKSQAKVYIQLDTLVTDDPDNLLHDIDSLRDTGIDGIALWYNPGVSGKTSKISALESTLKRLKRSG